jgi:hypothetical protein
MSKCRFEDKIDGYLLNRMGGTEREEFEEHYFNCASCFQKLRERDILIRMVKARGPALVSAGEAERPRRVLWALSPRTLAAAAIGLVLMAVALILLPRFQGTAPEFVLTGDGTVRGGTIVLVSPRGDLAEPPASLEWRPAGTDLEFRVYLFQSDVVWTEVTRTNSIALPEDIRRRLADGEEYSWQVKAFSAQGGLTALSDRIRFRVKPAR